MTLIVIILLDWLTYITLHDLIVALVIETKLFLNDIDTVDEKKIKHTRKKGVV